MISKDSIFYNPLLVIVITTDFILMVLIFLNRVYYGSAYNDCFKQSIANLTLIQQIYQNISPIYKTYFKFDCEIRNPVYKKVIDRINTKLRIYEEKENKKLNFEEQMEFVKSIIDINIESIGEIINQVQYDLENFPHKFLGVFSSDFSKNVSTILTVAVFASAPIIKVLKQRLGTLKFSI